MIESDYIMRMINRLCDVIAKVLKLKREENFPRAFAEISRGCRGLLGADFSFFDTFDEQQILEFLGKDPEYAPSRWYIMGALLQEGAGIDRAAGNEPEASRKEAKALALLLAAYLDCGPVVGEEHEGRLNSLTAATKNVALSPHTLMLLLRYLEQRGAFALAEDVVWRLVHSCPEKIAEGLAFYDRLLLLPDEVLAKGDLPRDEVLDGRKSLEQKIEISC